MGILYDYFRTTWALLEGYFGMGIIEHDFTTTVWVLLRDFLVAAGGLLGDIFDDHLRYILSV